ncbi:hypothetical protein, partial [Shigella sonnei]|uniref:hypothetical protein n=1 Tax=Shigella sonnei TaxID=624 RepID=UPI000A6CE59F
LYHTLNPDTIPGYKKFAQAIATDNFVQADDEGRLQQQPVPDPVDIATEALTYINPSHGRFHRLDKMLSFDDDQQALYE